MCSRCEKEHGHDNTGKCKPCDRSFFYLKLFFYIIFNICCISFYLYSNLNKESNQNPKKHSEIMKVLNNYLQYFMLIYQSGIKVPITLQTLMAYQKIFADTSENPNFTYDCILQQLNISEEKFFYIKIAFTAFLPAFYIIFYLIFWTIIYNVKKKKKNSSGTLANLQREYLIKRVGASSIIILYYFYPSVMRETFSLLQCIEVKKGLSVILKDSAIKCWNLDHILFIIFVFLPLLIVYFIGYPLWVYFHLKKLFDNRSIRVTSNIKFSGFLSKGYKIER